MVLELLDLHCMRRCFHVHKRLFLSSCRSLQLAASNLRIYMSRVVTGLGSTASSGTSSFGKRILSMVIKAFITKKCCRGFLVTEIQSRSKLLAQHQFLHLAQPWTPKNRIHRNNTCHHAPITLPQE